MLAKQQRLNLRLLNLKYFFVHATKINSLDFYAYFSVTDLPVDDQNKLKIAVVVSKKVSLLAVKRNSLKRFVYAILENQYQLLEQKVKPNKAVQIAIFMKKTALKADKLALQTQISKLIEQIISKIS